LSIRYTERLAEAGAVTSVGSKGDSYDNALAESVIGLYKTELIYNETQGPWRTVEDVELATLGWVHWWNTKRLLEPIGHVPPVEFEQEWLEKQALRSPLCDQETAGGITTADEAVLDELLVGAITN
jgi:putative transposase